MAKVNWRLNDSVTPDDMNLIGEEINQANQGVNALKENNSTTDNMIGDRTINDVAAPTVNTGKITSLMGWLAYMIKAITGKSNWRTAPATTLEATKAHIDDTTRHITASERAAWNAKETSTGVQTKIDAHADLTNNPHVVTKAQVGLGNVVNYGLATQSEAETGASDVKYMTPLRTKEAIQKLVPTPTKADVGLGSVDNIKQATKIEFDAHASDAVKHITASERTVWNAKANTAVATASVNGLMAATDKVKLDGVESSLSSHNSDAVKHITAAERAAWNAKETTSGAQAKADDAQATAISTAATDATNKVNSHANDAVKHITATERSTWNAKASTSLATTTASGLMGATDKSKLDGVATGANNYTHPSSHPASIITQDANNRFVTDAEKTTWNTKASTSVATTSANGLMGAADKSKLDGVDTGANNYTHPSSHAASIITQDANNRFVTDAEKTTWNAKASTAVATTSANGLMGAADKSKLDGVATGANNYTHPSSHAASIITQDANNRFVTDAEKTTWNAKASTAVATTNANGLMSNTDKSKLDGVAASANNYVHPTTHPPSMVAQDANNRFVSDTEKNNWNAKASTAIATTSTNGLMASTDKAKLDDSNMGVKVISSSKAPADLNTTYTTGVHHCGTSTANRPINENGTCFVFGAADAEGMYCSQKYVTWSNKTYERTKNNNVWTGWRFYEPKNEVFQMHPHIDGTTVYLSGVDFVDQYGFVATFIPSIKTNTVTHIQVGAIRIPIFGDRVQLEVNVPLSFIYTNNYFFLRNGGGGDGGKLNIYTQNTGWPDVGDKRFRGIVMSAAVPINKVMFDTAVWSAGDWNPDSTSIKLPNPATFGSIHFTYLGETYRLGGSSGTSSFHRYNQSNNTWTELTKHSSPFTSETYAYAVAGDFLYTFTGGISFNSSYKYSFKDNTWSAISNYPSYVVGARAVSVGTSIYIHGGSGNSDSVTPSLYRYNTLSDTFTTLAPSTEVCFGHVMAHYNGIIYALGGRSRSAASSNISSRRMYNIATNSWSTADPNWLTLRHYTGFQQVDNTLYIGSSNDNNFVTINLQTLNITTKAYPVTGSQDGDALVSLSGSRILVSVRKAPNDRIFVLQLTAKSYPIGTVIVVRNGENIGRYATEIVSPSTTIEGLNTKLETGFDDVVYFDGTNIVRHYTSYYGDGTKWVQFK